MKIDPKLINGIDLFKYSGATLSVSFEKVNWDLDSGCENPPDRMPPLTIPLASLVEKFGDHPVGDRCHYTIADITAYLKDWFALNVPFFHKGFEYMVCGVTGGTIYLEGLYDITEEMRNDSPEARDYANRIEDAVHRKAQMDFAVRKLIRDTELAMNDRGCTMEERLRRIDELTTDFRKEWGGIEMN